MYQAVTRKVRVRWVMSKLQFHVLYINEDPPTSMFFILKTVWFDFDIEVSGSGYLDFYLPFYSDTSFGNVTA